MHAKKLLSLLLSALAAVTLLASCGSRWDYSREAVKAANEAQGETLRVEFQVDQKFTNALHDAVEENIQPADVEKAMLADASLKELLTSGYRLNVYALRADVDAEEAARTIAEEQILPRLSGCKDEGIISMVKADNNYFYEAVLTYKESSAGGGHEPGKPEESDPQPTMYKVTVADYDTTLGTVTAPEEVEKGGSFTFTVEPGENADVTSVSVSGDYENCEDAEETYTVSNVQSDITITVVFEEKEEEYPVQWYETNDGEYEAGTLIFRKGASAVMGNTHTLTLDATIKGLQAKQYAANPTAADNFSFQNVVHLIVKEGSGVTEIPGVDEDKLNLPELELMQLKDTFCLSQKLKDISLSGVEKVGKFAFCWNTVEKAALTNAENIDIGDGAFKYCTFLSDVTIDAKSDLKIGNSAFDGALGVGASFVGQGCTTKLTGNSIWIGEEAFLDIYDNITLEGDVKKVGSKAFAEGNLGVSPINTYVTIHYQPGAEEFAKVCDGGLEGVGLTEENFA